MNLPARVALRLAPTDTPRTDRSLELARLFDGPVRIVVEKIERDPAALAGIVTALGAVAVLVDSHRPGSTTEDLEELRQAIAPVPLLRPILERRPGLHAGLPGEQFARYGRLGPDGTLIELPDGALA